MNPNLSKIVISQDEGPQLLQLDMPPVAAEYFGVLSGGHSSANLSWLRSAALYTGTHGTLVLLVHTVADTVIVLLRRPTGNLVMGQVQLLEGGRVS